MSGAVADRSGWHGLGNPVLATGLAALEVPERGEWAGIVRA
ncbi:hypothetical protein [Acetobacter vaccinii]|nr:hypothetical protein [Acetobacter vaccinii]